MGLFAVPGGVSLFSLGNTMPKKNGLLGGRFSNMKK
jgi:hypothetical protein